MYTVIFIHTCAKRRKAVLGYNQRRTPGFVPVQYPLDYFPVFIRIDIDYLSGGFLKYVMLAVNIEH
jgi:hypothetical protein